MEKFNVGDYVVFRRDKRFVKDVWTVCAVASSFDMLKLRNNKTSAVCWYNVAEVRRCGFYQPELVNVGG